MVGFGAFIFRNIAHGKKRSYIKKNFWASNTKPGNLAIQKFTIRETYVIFKNEFFAERSWIWFQLKLDGEETYGVEIFDS